jgi:hypothetical protein
LAQKYKEDLSNKVNKLTQDTTKKQTIIQKLVDKIDSLANKSTKAKKTLLILIKNNLMKEL